MKVLLRHLPKKKARRRRKGLFPCHLIFISSLPHLSPPRPTLYIVCSLLVDPVLPDIALHTIRIVFFLSFPCCENVTARNMAKAGRAFFSPPRPLPNLTLCPSLSQEWIIYSTVVRSVAAVKAYMVGQSMKEKLKEGEKPHRYSFFQFHLLVSFSLLQDEDDQIKKMMKPPIKLFPLDLPQEKSIGQI